MTISIGNAVAMHQPPTPKKANPSSIMAHHDRCFHVFPSINPTILSSLAAGSLGCAPTPNQYFTLLLSNWMFLYFFSRRSVSSPKDCSGAADLGDVDGEDVLGPEGEAEEAGMMSEERGTRGMGSYVPRTSMGRELRAVLGGFVRTEGESWDMMRTGKREAYRACARTML